MEVTWFHPVLLRLELKSYAPWIAGITVPTMVAMLISGGGTARAEWEYLPYIVGTSAALTSTLLLPRTRARRWVGVLAGIAYGLGLRAGRELVPDPGPWAVANILFGVVLLNGTKPRHPQGSAEAPGD
jgi:hypothetical protein